MKTRGHSLPGPACLALLFLLGSAWLQAEPLLRAAARAEAAGQRGEALNAYTSWLDAADPSHPAFLETLLRASVLNESAAQAARFLESRLSRLSGGGARRTVLKRMAFFRQAAGDLVGAQAAFESAALAEGLEIESDSLLRSGELLFEMGEFQKAEEQARAVLAAAAGPEDKKRALILLARLMVWTGRRDEGLRILGESAQIRTGGAVDARALLYLVELGLMLNERGIAEQAGSRLDKEYPGSPENLLAKELLHGERTSVLRYPVPSQVLPPGGLRSLEPVTPTAPAPAAQAVPAPRPSGVQIGSFGMRENALYLVRDMERKGFSPVIREERRQDRVLFRVIVPIPADRSIDPQTVLIRLNDAGFEGFFVF